jgi:hypothetical protein
MKVVNQSSPKTNPQKVNLPETNPQPSNTQLSPQPQINLNNLETVVEEVIRKYMQSLQQQNINNKTGTSQNQQLNDEFIVKSTMKSSLVALRIENLLLGGKKRVKMSGLGFAIPVLIDSALLVKKDLAKRGITVNIENIELFEREAQTDGGRKIVSGVKITLSI